VELAYVTKVLVRLAHDPNVETGFPKRSCSNKEGRRPSPIRFDPPGLPRPHHSKSAAAQLLLTRGAGPVPNPGIWLTARQTTAKVMTSIVDASTEIARDRLFVEIVDQTCTLAGEVNSTIAAEVRASLR